MNLFRDTETQSHYSYLISINIPMRQWLPAAVAATHDCTLIKASHQSHLMWHVSLSVQYAGTDSLTLPFLFLKINHCISKSCIHCPSVSSSTVCVTWIGGKIEHGVILQLWNISAHTRARHMKHSLKEKVNIKRQSYKEKEMARGQNRIGGRGKSKNQCSTVNWLLGKFTRTKLLLSVFHSIFASLSLASTPPSAFPGTLIWTSILFRYWPMHSSMVKPRWSSHQSDV